MRDGSDIRSCTPGEAVRRPLDRSGGAGLGRMLAHS
jgi:hypothetical protein